MRNIREEDKTLMMLIGDVHRQFGHKIKEQELKNGFGMATSCIMMELNRFGKMTQVELVQKIHMRPSSVSVALQKMEHDGLISKESKDDDQRYFVVSLTEKGKDICNEMRQAVFDLDCFVTNSVDPKELEIAKKVLREISNKFMEANK